MSLSGRRYSQNEIAGLLAQAGWPANLIPTMSAIVMAESSGYQGAHNSSGENSCGLCQVYVDVHRELNTTCAAEMSDPVLNLRHCLRIYNDRGGGVRGFNAWGAYSDGRYRKFLGGGGSPIQPTVQRAPSNSSTLNNIAANLPASENQLTGASWGQDAFIVIAVGLAGLLVWGQLQE